MTHPDPASTAAAISQLTPLLRQFCRSEYGIALGGAHAKGVDDAESDLDLYVFARDVLPAAGRATCCRQFSGQVSDIVCWGEDTPFVQGGADFLYGGRKVECWLRHIDYIAGIIGECQAGVVRQELVTWTVMGFYNHCALSDLRHMVIVEDPSGILSAWKATVSRYPPRLQQAIIDRHLAAAWFWPDNFHYQSAVERCDTIYTAGIVQQVVHNLIQVIFAINQTYFPGDKKLDIALGHLAAVPDRLVERIQRLISPGVSPDRAALREQRAALRALAVDVRSLAGTR